MHGDASGLKPGAQLRVTRRALLTPTLALAVLGVALTAAELVARTDAVRTRLPPPSVGSPHRQFEVQLSKLDRLVERRGPIDHLFIGSSVVYCGIDPVVVGGAYRERTGRELLGFTFGVNGMTAATSGLMADLLVQRYHPAVLVYGLSPLDLVPAPEIRAGAKINASPWVQYRDGHWSLAGWLIDHSAAYRLYLSHRAWRGPGYAHNLRQGQLIEEYTSAFGFGSDPRPGDNRRVPDGSSLPPAAAYTISAEARAGLERIARLHRQGIPVVLVEIPLQPVALHEIPGGEEGHRAFVEALDAFAAAQAIPFWRPRSADPIPESGWKDRHHLNPTGARAFSRWLGERLAEYESARRDRDATRPAVTRAADAPRPAEHDPS